MKTTKLVIGILSVVLFAFIAFQSCAVGVVNAVESNAADTSGGAGMLLAFVFLVAGVVGAVARNSKGAGITAGILYLFGAIVGFANQGTYGDLVVWAFISLAFGVVFLIGSLRTIQAKRSIDA